MKIHFELDGETLTIFGTDAEAGYALRLLHERLNEVNRDAHATVQDDKDVGLTIRVKRYSDPKETNG